MRALWDPFFSGEVLDLLGVRAASDPLDGCQGRVWLLEDGRALKLTTSADEAASALAILETPQAHPSLARVDAVHWVPYGASYSPDRIIYAVMREEMPSVAVAGKAKVDWFSSFETFRRGWEQANPVRARKGMDRWRPHGTELEELLDCLEWMRDCLGVRLLDLEPGNVGRLPGRGVAPRDLGVGEFREHLTRRVKNLDFEPLRGLSEATLGPR